MMPSEGNWVLLRKDPTIPCLQVQSCQRCHDDSIYTRKDSIIYSYKALVKRVHFCESMAHAGWNENDFNDVIAYLNQRFYKFKTSP